VEHDQRQSPDRALTSKRIIFDFGANNGDDIPYYLMKSEQVVAVEANPILAGQIRERFAEPIAQGRLVVESCALTVDSSTEQAPFYVHRTNHVLSQFPEPPPEVRAQFDRITVPTVNVVELVRRHGEPYYVKIDIEHYDQAILRALFEAGIVPPYISAESHSIEVLALLIALGGYEAFKLVDGRTVPTRYRGARVRTTAGEAVYSFPPHSAGPFGEDIAGPWMTRNNFFRVLSFAGLGWKDIHASRVDAPDPRHAPSPQIQIRIDF
jgi:FkbM family methyltransferase